MSTFVEVHVLHYLPLSCINRDRSGAPKSMTIGWERRARWSSQSVKRHLRRDVCAALEEEMAARGVEKAIRTRRLPILTRDELVTLGVPVADANAWVTAAFKVANLTLQAVAESNTDTTATDADPAGVPVDDVEDGEAEPGDPLGPKLTGRTGALIAARRSTAYQWAQLIFNEQDFLSKVAAAQKEVAAVKGDAKKAPQARLDAILKGGTNLKQKMNEALKADGLLDVALFGRFLAEIPAVGNVEAAVQVAHAFTTHPDDYVTDFWTSNDEVPSKNNKPGTAGMGDQGLTSGVYYRYAACDLGVLLDGPLKDNPDMARLAVAQFVGDFMRLRPTAMKNSSAPNTDPVLVVATVTPRTRSMAGAFVKPVEPDYLNESAVAMGALWAKGEQVWGPIPNAWTLVAHPDIVDIDQLPPQVTSHEDLVRHVDQAAFGAQ